LDSRVPVKTVKNLWFHYERETPRPADCQFPEDYELGRQMITMAMIMMMVVVVVVVVVVLTMMIMMMIIIYL
jgi:hypothetical protein